jgi:outer membrane protein assembly factor BamB
MRPVALGDRILSRRLTSDGPELACLDAAGTVIWTAKPDDYAASDPVVVDGKPLALFASHEGTGKIGLALVEFAAATGRVRSRVPLAEFRESPRRPLVCQLTAAEDRLVATVAGCVLACSPAGRVQWIRRQVFVPPPALDYQNSREWLEQYHEPLLAAGGRVYATQPGVWGIECMELEGGRLLWRQGSGNLVRLAGRAGDRIMVQTSDGPAALDPESGKLLWFRGVKDCLATRICGPTGPVLSLSVHVGRKASHENPSGIVLSWIDPEAGSPLASTVLEMPAQGGLYVGPLVAAGGRQWLAMAPRQQPTRRQMLEALRTGDAAKP